MVISYARIFPDVEGVLLVSSTGFAPGSIYGSTSALRTTEFWLPTSDFDQAEFS